MTVWAKETIPPPPKAYFNDYAGVTRADTARRLNAELAQFERDTSTQIVAVVYRKMDSDSSIEDYTVRIAQSWRVGQKGRNNGAVLFVFIQDQKMFIQVGYGLEGALTDFLCNQIINNEIKPRFRAGDFDGGLTAGTHSMMAAVKGEYKGTGRTTNERTPQSGFGWGWLPVVVIFFVLMAIARLFRRFSGGGGPPRMYTGGGPTWFDDSSSGGMGGGGSSDSFGGGGGSFGGGGAGGDW